MIAACLLRASAAQAPPSGAAEDILVGFAQHMCREEVDRLAEAERFVPSGWREYEREERRNVLTPHAAQAASGSRSSRARAASSSQARGALP